MIFNNATDIKVGFRGIDKAYLGSTLIWQRNYANEYLTITPEQDIMFSFTQPISYSTDGVTWTSLPANTYSPIFTDPVKIKATYVPDWPTDYMKMSVDNQYTNGRYSVSGNIMSLIYGDNFAGVTTMSSSLGYAFYYLFGQTPVVNAHNLVLPATTLAQHCYEYMFMECTSLTTVPVLPATTLAEYCYQFMFFGCTSITSAPNLPATTLAQYCYNQMFTGCTSLTTAPVLPATTLTNGCYQLMFNGCTSLNSITMLATDISATVCLNLWVQNVSPTGTFVKDSAMTTLPTGDNGIPIGWTVNNAVQHTLSFQSNNYSCSDDLAVGATFSGPVVVLYDGVAIDLDNESYTISGDSHCNLVLVEEDPTTGDPLVNPYYAFEADPSEEGQFTDTVTITYNGLTASTSVSVEVIFDDSSEYIPDEDFVHTDYYSSDYGDYYPFVEGDYVVGDVLTFYVYYDANTFANDITSECTFSSSVNTVTYDSVNGYGVITFVDPDSSDSIYISSPYGSTTLELDCLPEEEPEPEPEEEPEEPEEPEE